MAGLGDLFDVRMLLLVSAVVLIGCGLLALTLPGLGQPAAEWRRTLAWPSRYDRPPRTKGNTLAP